MGVTSRKNASLAVGDNARNMELKLGLLPCEETLARCTEEYVQVAFSGSRSCGEG